MNTATLSAAPQKLSLTIVPTNVKVEGRGTATSKLIIEFEIDGRISDLKKVAQIEVLSNTVPQDSYVLAVVPIPLLGRGTISVPYNSQLKRIGFCFVDHLMFHSNVIGFDIEESVTLVKREGTDGRK